MHCKTAAFRPSAIGLRPGSDRRSAFVCTSRSPSKGLARLVFFSLRSARLRTMSNHFALSLEAPPEPTVSLSPVRAWTLLLLVFAAVHVAALFAPSLLDDADANHANAAQHMAQTGDWVTLKVDGIRYLEKPPLPYWLVAADYHLFGYNVFATHLPLTLGVLGLSVLAWVWGRRAYGDRAAFYAALSILTSVGVFLFTRIFIPEVLLSLLLAFALYSFLTGLEDGKPNRFYLTWASLGLAMLAKGLIAPVFFLLAAFIYLLLTGEWRRWRQFRLFSGILLFLAIAAPWHIIAGLRNPGAGHPVGNIPSPGNVHGFFYFYFINEQVLRFLGRRYPVDYNKLPFVLYWSLHLVWLFPWSLFLPVLLQRAWSSRRRWESSGAAKTIQRCPPPSGVPCPDHVAAVDHSRGHPDFLFAFHQPGVLHLPGLLSAVVADRGCARQRGDPGASRPGSLQEVAHHRARHPGPHRRCGRECAGCRALVFARLAFRQ